MDYIEIINFAGSIVTIMGAIISVIHSRRAKRYSDMTTDKYCIIEYQNMINVLRNLVSTLDNWIVPSPIKRGLDRGTTFKTISDCMTKLSEVKAKIDNNFDKKKDVDSLYQNLEGSVKVFAEDRSVDNKISVDAAKEIQSQLRSLINIFSYLINNQ